MIEMQTMGSCQCRPVYNAYNGSRNIFGRPLYLVFGHRGEYTSVIYDRAINEKEASLHALSS